MKIICMSCDPGAPEVEEADYPAHMEKFHPSGQLGSIAAKKNVPKQAPVNLPPGINPGDLPDPEFLKTIEEMEKEAVKPQKPVLAQSAKPQETARKDQSPPSSPVAEKTPKDFRPLRLVYKWEGQCSTCGNTVKTIVVEDYAVAYCLNCDEDVKKQKVEPLDKTRAFLTELPKKAGRPKKVKDNASI